MGTGSAVKGKRVCKGVMLTIGKMMIVEYFLPLELGDVKVVLGMQWLRTIDVTEVDWRVLNNDDRKRNDENNN